MKKSILNLGKALSKAEQKEVFGGFDDTPLRKECDPNRNPGCNCYYHYGQDAYGNWGKIKTCV
jgi:hypothetical protein